MTVDWFLIDAPHVVPEEFQAWDAAVKRHHSVFLRCCEAPEGSDEQVALDAEGVRLKAEADRLERIARSAWEHKR